MHYPFVAVRRGRAALAALGVVCYNAGPRQFNSNDPWLSGFVNTARKRQVDAKKT
jgi:hypothetical protein